MIDPLSGWPFWGPMDVKPGSFLPFPEPLHSSQPEISKCHLHVAEVKGAGLCSAFLIGEAAAAAAGVPEYPWVGGRHTQPLITEKQAQACADRPPESPSRWPAEEEGPQLGL